MADNKSIELYDPIVKDIVRTITIRDFTRKEVIKTLNKALEYVGGLLENIRVEDWDVDVEINDSIYRYKEMMSFIKVLSIDIPYTYTLRKFTPRDLERFHDVHMIDYEWFDNGSCHPIIYHHKNSGSLVVLNRAHSIPGDDVTYITRDINGIQSFKNVNHLSKKLGNWII